MYPSSHAAIFKKERKAKNAGFTIEKLGNNNSLWETSAPLVQIRYFLILLAKKDVH